LRIVVAEEGCMGCRYCENICSVHFVDEFRPAYSAIRVVFELPESHVMKPNVCRQCESEPPPCAEACPAGAIVKDEKLGIYVVDRESCTACGSCVEACPYDAIFLPPGAEFSVKCDLCGGQPKCVEWCPRDVLRLE